MMYKNLFGAVLISLLSACPVHAQFHDVEVTIRSTDPEVLLAGTLTVPNSIGRHPAVVLIPGNGPHTRDVVVSGSPLFKQLAEHLASSGFVVLRMDKRGFGKSSGAVDRAEGNYTTYDLAKDIMSALDFLDTHPSIDTSKVGVIGHSEGGLIAAIVAAEVPGLDWAVSVAGPAVPGDSIVAEQTRINRKNLGIPTGISEAIEKVWFEYFEFIKKGYTSDSEFEAIGRRFLMAHGLPENDPRITRPFMNQLLDEYKSEWYVYFFETNPTEYLKQIRTPFLGILGSHDEQVTVEQNFLPMYQALKNGGNAQFQLNVLPDEDHFFARFDDQRMQKHEFGKMEISNRLLLTIECWLQAIGVVE